MSQQPVVLPYRAPSGAAPFPFCRKPREDGPVKLVGPCYGKQSLPLVVRNSMSR